MTPFAYRAVDPRGRIVRGRLDASNLAELELRLSRLDLELIHGKPAPRRYAPWQRQLPRRELINFCFHLEQFLQAGVPIIESLADLRDTIEHPHFREIVTTLVGAIEGGETLSQALERHPQVFDNVFCSLIRAGERAGELPTVLRAISSTLKRDDELAAFTRRIAIYPAIVALVILAAIGVALIYVVPELARLFQTVGQALPLQTRILVGLSEAVRDWGWAMLLGALGGAALGAHALARSEALRTRLHALQLRLPLVGGILRKLALARFAALFATLYGAGINVIDALHTSTGATANLALRAGLREATSAIEQGRPISVAFEATQVFPPLVIRMLRLGEHTGALDDALAKVASLYRRDVAEGIARLQAAAEPALTILMGGLLLWIASAILGPIYELITRLPV